MPRILELVCRTTGMGFSAVARVTEDRWIACAVRDEIAFGLEPGGELEIHSTICDEIRQSGQLVVIDHVSEDAAFRDHHTPKRYGFQSYISVPIRLPGGEFFGTLCAIDPAPARVNTAETIGMFQLFADLVGFHLQARQRLDASALALAEERRRAQLRDQFIAVLGHDLRNPLGAVLAGSDVLARLPLDERGRRVASVIRSSASRMAGLVDNVLDFARGQLGDGIPVQLEPVDALDGALEQVLTELRTTWPDRTIEADWQLGRPVVCDKNRIAQLFSNLVANALAHGDASAPVRVRAVADDAVFELAVANKGEPIPAEAAAKLFLPFARASEGPGQQGLGLGLYIASEISRAHGGTLRAVSADGDTEFTFRMPRLPD